jgi:tRNA (mo5U34)-methyltransferase
MNAHWQFHELARKSVLDIKLRKSRGVRVTSKVHGLIRNGDASRDLARWSEAAAAYQAALATDPSLGHIWVQYGHALLEGGDAGAAAMAYAKACIFSPEDPDAHLHAARLQRRLGAPEEAARGYRQVLALTPQNDEARGALEEIDGGRPPPNQGDPAQRVPRLPPGMSLAETQARLDQMRWHHSIDFGGGLVSKAMASPEFIKLTGAALYEGLTLRGRSLLDIGAWNGAYSFEAKWRGAERVVATDKIAWAWPYNGRETFDIGLQLTGLDIEAVEIDVPEIRPERLGRFDVVLFAGVFYHLIDAIERTRQISECAEHLLILETHHDALDYARPAMVFYPGATLGGDSTNWWGPNPQCLYELLSELGFAVIHYRDAPHFGDGTRGVYHAYRTPESMARLGVGGPASGWVSLADPAAREALFRPR